MKTRWTDSVNLDAPHPEYPRPLLQRTDWVNLNGRWDFEIGGEAMPSAFTRQIIVPFAVECHLSGVVETVPDGRFIWYRRTFAAPTGERVLLNFGAVDWDTQVWVNGTHVGAHQGGYDAFSFDITDALAPEGDQVVVVRVSDPTDAGTQPRGKQSRTPEHIFYTPTTGIWQTVWLEPVPAARVEGLKILPTNDGTIMLGVTVSGEGLVTVTIPGEVTEEFAVHGSGTFKLAVTEPKLWSPESPHLYDLEVKFGDDSVKSYFAFREVGLGKDAHGVTRLMLNGTPLFMIGPLDQGYWPDGIYTAPTYDAMIFDIDETRKLGFNMIRKHVKVEPQTWYAHCDRTGMLVWQDMPSGDRSISPGEPDIERTPESKAVFQRELKAMVDALYNHPSIVTWVLFNEGWGQFDTIPMAQWLRDYDGSRILDAVTGWCDRGVGDMHDWHIYPGPESPLPEENRAAVLGEFGGIGLVVPGHMWEESGWGYKSYPSAEELTENYETLFEKVRELITAPGLSAAIYTQTTDVETEANGLFTYDREVMKMDASRVKKAVLSLTLPSA